MIKSRIFQSTEGYDVQTRLDNFFAAYPHIKILNLEYRTTPVTMNGGYEKQHVHYSVLIIFQDETSSS